MHVSRSQRHKSSKYSPRVGARTNCWRSKTSQISLRSSPYRQTCICWHRRRSGGDPGPGLPLLILGCQDKILGCQDRILGCHDRIPSLLTMVPGMPEAPGLALRAAGSGSGPARHGSPAARTGSLRLPGLAPMDKLTPVPGHPKPLSNRFKVCVGRRHVRRPLPQLLQPRVSISPWLMYVVVLL